MNVAVSIPDELFDRADAVARSLGKSRSQLYQEALAEYLLRREDGAVTGAMDETLAGLESLSDPWLREASRQLLERSEW